MSSCPDNAEQTQRTTTMLERLTRFGFRYEQILDDRRGIEAVVYLRPGDHWRDVVVVYAEQVARAYRRRPPHDPEPHPFAVVDPTDVLRSVPLAAAAGVLDTVLNWPTEEPAPLIGAQR